MLRQKRINKELSVNYIPKFFDKKLPYHLVISKYHDVPCELNLIHNNNMKIVLTITIPNDYPFHSPTILLSSETVNKLNLIGFKRNKFRVATWKYTKWCSELLTNYRENDLLLAWIFTKIRYPHMSKLWHNAPRPSDCLCCSSITCGNNWAPSYSVYDLVAEYLLYKQFFCYTSPLILRQIKNIFYSLFNNKSWVLGDDLISHIFNYCCDYDAKYENIIHKLGKADI